MHHTDFVPFQNVSFGVVVCLILMRHIREVSRFLASLL